MLGVPVAERNHARSRRRPGRRGVPTTDCVMTLVLAAWLADRLAKVPGTHVAVTDNREVLGRMGGTMPCDGLVTGLVRRVPRIHFARSRVLSSPLRRFLVGLTCQLRFSAIPAEHVDRRGMNDAMNHDVLGEREHQPLDTTADRHAACVQNGTCMPLPAPVRERSTVAGRSRGFGVTVADE